MPFHRVEQWNGSYFQQSWLRNVGVAIYLGHDFNPCPTARPFYGDAADPGQAGLDGEIEDEENDPIFHVSHAEGSELPSHDHEQHPKGRDSNGNELITIIDQSGIHTIPVVPCFCPNAPSEEHQYLKTGMFPASFQNVKTAFTFLVLDDFLITNRECKTSAASYFNKLRMLTSPEFPMRCPVGVPLSLVLSISHPSSVQNRYRELLRASRQWRNLKSCMEIRSFGEEDADQPQNGEAALFCAACPQPGINLPLNWEPQFDRCVNLRKAMLMLTPHQGILFSGRLCRMEISPPTTCA